MKAVGVRKYGGVDVFEELEVNKPKVNSGDILIKVKACSVNPIDVKVRGGVYDDYPDYYSHTTMEHDKYQILGFDGSGVIEEVGSDVDKTKFQKGDEVYYLASPFRQAGNADYVAASTTCFALKPKNLSFEEAAGVPLTGLTAHQCLVERLEIKEGEQCGILIINGAGGVGSIATQICSKILKLPVIISTASKEESKKFAKKMGATHIVNHHEDIPKQIAELNLKIPLKYAFITHTTVDEYVKVRIYFS
jgi:NADPH:quinone reductase-like Zn-dependent oxidoreductase